MSKKQEIYREIVSYMGIERAKLFGSISKEDLELFKSKCTSLDTSYYVRGSRLTLDNFVAFYLGICNRREERRKYEVRMLTDYVVYLSSPNEDDLGVPELLFIRAHANEMGFGNTEAWIKSTLINNIANRNRKGYTTIFLTERDLPEIKDCGELECINLLSAKRSTSQIGTRTVHSTRNINIVDSSQSNPDILKALTGALDDEQRRQEQATIESGTPEFIKDINNLKGEDE